VAIISLVLLFIGIFCCLPIYIFKYLEIGESSPQYSTHSYLYRWIWTTAYATSQFSSSVMLCAWACSIFLFVYLLSLWLADSSPSSPSCSSSCSSSPSRSIEEDPFQTLILQLMSVTQFTSSDAIQLLTLALLNIIIVGGVNVAYIIAIFSQLSPTNHLLIQLSMAAFKYYWNFVCVPWLILGPLKNTRYKAGLRLTFMLINSIWLPFLVTALTSPSCFRNVLISPKEIESVYSYLTCDTILNGQCIEFELFSIEVIPLSPAFSYDYLCASSVIAVYLPVFIYTSCLLVVTPFLYTYLLVGHTSYEALPSRLRKSIHGIIWPDAWRQTDITQLSDNDLRQFQTSVNRHTSIPNKFNTSNTSPSSRSSSGESEKNNLPSPETLLKVQTIVATLMHHIAILLTFGLCCPVLAFTVTSAICVSVLQWKYLVGRFVTSRLISRDSVRMVMNNRRVVDAALITLELSVGTALDYFRATLWPVLWTSCTFFVFVCWDMAGDVVGWKAALWAPCGVISFAIFIGIFMRARKHQRFRSRGGSSLTNSFVIEKMESNPLEESSSGGYRDEGEERNRETNRTTDSFQIEYSPGGTPTLAGRAKSGGGILSSFQKIALYSREKNGLKYSESDQSDGRSSNSNASGLKTVNLGSSC
jgi:hypothetical protein